MSLATPSAEEAAEAEEPQPLEGVRGAIEDEVMVQEAPDGARTAGSHAEEIPESEPVDGGSAAFAPGSDSEYTYSDAHEDDRLGDEQASEHAGGHDDEEFQQPRGLSRSARRRRSRVAAYSPGAVEIVRVNPLSDERVRVLRELLQRHRHGLRDARAAGDTRRAESLTLCIQDVQKVIDLEYYWRQQPSR